MAYLDRLISIRSDTTLDVLAFLAETADALDATPWTWPHTGRPILASDVFVDLDVLTRPSEPESLPQPGGRQVIETDAARYELPAAVDQTHRLGWTQLMRRPRRHVLKGAPGSGKSFLSRHATVARLRQAHDDLLARRVSLAELPATLWVSAPALADADGEAPLQVLSSAAAGSVEGVTPLPPRVRAWLEARLLDRSACMVVDAVDEVSPEKYPAFRRRLREIAALPGQLIVTCRTLQWELLKPELQPVVSAEEVELAPLTPVQQRLLIQRLFPDAGAAAPVLTLLHQNRGLRHACTTPLRLLLVCLLARDGRLGPDTTYASLYTHLLRALIEGRWRSRRPRWTSKSVRVEQTIGVLTRIGWALFSAAPANNRFNLSAWTRAMAGLSDRPAPGGRLLEDLVTLGVLVPAGFDELGDRCWSFAHRTLLEYLAARELASRTTDEWLEQVRGHFWFEPEWTEVLTFLASIVPDATPLVIAVDREEDDIFGSMLELRARLVGIARRVSTARARRVAVEVLGLALIGHGGTPQARIVPAGRPQRCASALGWAALGPWLAEVVESHRDEWLRRDAVRTLGSLEPTESVSPLVRMLHSDPSQTVRSAVAEALGDMGAPEAVAPLVNALRTDSGPAVRRESARALQRLADTGAVQPLLDALRGDPDPDVRREAAVAIATLSADQAVEALVDAVSGDPNDDVRRAAADQLGNLGAAGSVPGLTRALFGLAGDEASESEERSEPRKRVRARKSIVWALGKIGGPEAVAALVEVLRRDEPPTLHSSASVYLRMLGADDALAAIADSSISLLLQDADVLSRRQAVASLTGFADASGPLARTLASDRDGEVRCQAIFSLSPLLESSRLADHALRSLTQALRRDTDREVRRAAAIALWDTRATPSLVEAMRTDDDDEVRRWAAVTLGEKGDGRAVAPLLEALQRDPHWSVRDSAAEALGKHGTAEAIEPLLAVLQGATDGDDILGKAREALGRCALARRTRPLRGGSLASLGWCGHAAIALNNLGIEFRNGGRLDIARTLLHAALALDRRTRYRHPKVAHRLMNLAGVELMRTRVERAARLLRRAWSASPHSPDVTSARVLAMRLIVALVQGEQSGIFLGQLKTILLDGSMSNVADVDRKSSAEPIIRSVQPRLSSSDLELVTALLSAVNGTRPVRTLDDCHRFAAQTSVPLDQPWENVR